MSHAAAQDAMGDASGDQPARGCGLRLLVGDEMGCVKVIEALSSRSISKGRLVARHGDLNAARRVTVVATCTTHDAAAGTAEGSVCVVAKAGGAMEIFDWTTGVARGVIAGHAEGDRQARQVVGLKALWPEGAVPTVVSLTAGGTLRVHARNSGAGEEWVEVACAGTGLQEAQCLDVCEDGEAVLAVLGGKGAEVQVWDVLQGKATWRARGGRPDPRTGLMDPPWTSACAFVPGSGCRRIVAGTGHYKLRLYDLDHGRRPKLEVTWDEARVTAVCPAPDGKTCWVANGRGVVSRWDLGTGVVTGILKGVSGSIRCLALHPEHMLIASGGLDRFLRVHHVGTLKPQLKMYLKNQISAIAWGPVSATEAAQAEEEERRVREAEAAQKEAEKKAASAKRRREGDEESSGDEGNAASAPVKVQMHKRGRKSKRGKRR